MFFLVTLIYWNPCPVICIETGELCNHEWAKLRETSHDGTSVPSRKGDKMINLNATRMYTYIRMGNIHGYIRYIIIIITIIIR
jgi:hypothetical protein